MSKLYSYKRWYGITEENKITKKKFIRKIKVKREYDCVTGYNIIRGEVGDNKKISDIDFLNTLKKYKTNKNLKEEYYRKFHVGNIFFKLKANVIKDRESTYKNFEKVENIILSVEILEQTEKLSQKSNITRKEIAAELVKKVQEGTLDINSKNISFKNLKIYLETEKLDKRNDNYGVRWKILSDKEIESKKLIYEECKKINSNLYSLINLCLSPKIFSKRYYIEELERDLLNKGEPTKLKNILQSFLTIRLESIQNKDNINYIKFLFNISDKNKKISENKKQFSEKVEYYLNDEIEIKDIDIIEFIIKELKYFSIIKRIEKMPNENLEKTNLTKTYITLDKHEKLKESENNKNEIVKKIIEKNKVDLKNEIIEILRIFNINELIQKIKKEICNNTIDTELYIVYKKHYDDCIKTYCYDCIETDFNDCIKKRVFKDMSSDKKELYKIIYRYLKGRIEKILQNRNYIRTNIIEIERIFNFDYLLEKIETRVKQYALEHILYLGKSKHNKIEKNNISFQNEHAEEELKLELITLFSSTNMELNKILTTEKKDGNIDFFGKDYLEVKINISNGSIATKLELFKELNFIDKNTSTITVVFKNFLEASYKIRNNILHGKSNNLLTNQKSLGEEYETIEKTINTFKISDKEICTSLNLDIVFEGKEKIIVQINQLVTSNNEEQKYLPSFSKLVPKIKKVILEKLKCEKNIEDIILNGAIYVNKILYSKETLNSESNFMKLLRKEFLESIEVEYKKAQISASKGNKKAIKKFQDKIIDKYIFYLEEHYEELLDFSKLKLTMDNIKNKIDSRKNSENKILLENIGTKTTPKNDFEYCLSVFALLNDNIIINKIKNRLFSTDVWLNLEESRYENLIKIITEIINANQLEEDLKKGKGDVGLININKLINELSQMEEVENEINHSEISIISDLKKKIFEESKNIILENIIINNFQEKDQHLIKSIIKEEKISLKTSKSRDGSLFQEKYEIQIVTKGMEPSLIDKIGTEKKQIAKSIQLFLEQKYYEELKKIQEIPTGILKKYYEELKKIQEFPTDILKKYKKTFEKLVENEKYKNIYYQEDKIKDEKIFIYKKNIFKNISNSNFEILYQLFIEKELDKTDTKILFNDEIRNKKIDMIDKILKKTNTTLTAYSKEYKDSVIKKLKTNDEYFRTFIGKNFEIKNYNELENIYLEVSTYKKTRDIIEFNYLNKINNYLVELNWKLAIQISRLERDLHHIVKGLIDLGILRLEEGALNQEVSKAYPSYKKGVLEYDNQNTLLKNCHYKFDEKNITKLIDICDFFNINLKNDGELNLKEKENIRNYIAHFYLVREPFEKYSLEEVIDKVSDLLSYRSKYNNSTYNAVFETFKKEVDLDYKNLKKKIRLKTIDIDSLIKNRKISVLELKNETDYVMMISKLLNYKRVKEDNK